METHHVRQDLCTTRPAYRQGRELKAVKSYSIGQESVYILVLGLPAIHIQDRLLKVMAKCGTVIEWKHLVDYPVEEFTEAILFKYQRIQSARAAKRKLDDHSFFGGVLHVCYAPEHETVDEARNKLHERRAAFNRRLKQIRRDRQSGKYNMQDDQEEDVPQDTQHREKIQRNFQQDTQHSVQKNLEQDNRTKPSQESRNDVPSKSVPFFAGYYPSNVPSLSHTANPHVPPFALPDTSVPPPNTPQPPPPLLLPPPITTAPMCSNPALQNRTQIYSYNEHRKPRETIVNSSTGQRNNTLQNQHSRFAGPSPPCGPYIPSGYKPDKPENKGRKRKKQGDEEITVTRNPAMKTTSQPELEQTQTIIKEYHPSVSTKFVPRQVPKCANSSIPEHLTKAGSLGTAVSDRISESLRRNALRLRDTEAGPRLPTEEEERHELIRDRKRPNPAMDSVVENIRMKVKQFAEKCLLPPQLKRKKAK